ncbi:MAG: hypothetical protein H0X40_02820 [Chthoniobacterales bacterium]|nr:hypothetical protein [Chthoniobacterales bacterium]
MSAISREQFALFRIALGVYLTIHFAQLLPYGAELSATRECCRTRGST